MADTSKNYIMNKLLAMPVRRLILLLVMSMMLAPIVHMVSLAIAQRGHDIHDSNLLLERLANQISNDQNLILSGAEQLLSTLAHIPSVQKRDARTVNKILADLIRINPQYSNLLVMDNKGLLWASAVPVQGTISYSDRRYFKNALKTGRFASGEYSISRTLNKPVMNFSYPIKDSSGAITDFAVVAFTTDKYVKQIKTSKLPANTSLLLTDHKGTIIFNLTSPLLEGKQDRDDLFRRMSEGVDQGFFEAAGNSGVRRYFAYSKLRLGNEQVPYMYVRVGMPVADVLEKATSQITGNLGVMSLVMLLSLAMAFYITRHGIIDKIVALRNATQKMALGNLDVRVSDQVSGGEFGDLAESFDHMANRLAEEMDEVTHHIEQRLQTEEFLKESRQQLMDIIDFLPDATFVIDNDKRVIAWNRAIEEMTGINKEEMIGQGNYAYSVPFYGERRRQLLDLLDSDNDELTAKYKDLIKKGTTLYAETYTPALYGGKGAYLWAIGAPLYNTDGQRSGAIESLRDITEKKNAEELRNNDLAMIESLLNNSPAGIRVFDAETGQCVLVNQSAADIAGGSREALLAQNFRRLESWKVSGLLPLAEQVLSDGDTRSIETVLHTSFDKVVPVTYLISRFFARDHPNLLVIGRDISEERRLGDEKRKIEEQMLHAQKLESMGVLAGGIAHDFNNILTAIIGNADLALMRLNPESPVLDNLHRIEKAAGRAAELAKQMLAYSGKGKFVIENIDLNRLVEEMLHMLEVSISKKAVLKLDLHRPLPTVEADATQLRQIIMNLVINASEAIGEKSGEIAITSGCMECDRDYLQDVWFDENLNDGLYVFLEIADTGCGMDRETLAKIFDPFFTTKFTGRGLGMAAVLGIVRAHKGAIKISSEPGKGTLFKILLPGSSKPEDIFNLGHNDAQWHGNGKVLLVDDEENIRAIGSEMLRVLGFQVVTAEDGRHALDLFKELDDFNLVILDLTMPHMDGEQTFREIRSIRPDIKVIISSGYNELEVTQRFVGKGLAGFIQKPFKLSTIRDVIRNLSI